jgi:hypothetical protein
MVSQQTHKDDLGQAAAHRYFLTRSPLEHLSDTILCPKQY